MQYIPGSSVTLSASLHYLAKNFPLPDDSDVQTRIPQICVDYLSHEWLEEDVWKSWRNMTRHKNEVANGVRLENASWRTWWKQRNKLKTVSPETLNWLKDSDVTWLYGPLHTAAEPVPKPKQSTYVDRYNLEKASGKKPILKHRTISELLNIPANDHTAPVVQHSLGSPSLEAVSMDFGLGEDAVRTGSPQPSLPHARSDSAIARRAISLPVATVGSPVSTDSPLQPRPTDSDSTPPRSGSPATQSDGTGLSHDFGSQIHLSPKGTKRHISFNTFVEQCISIDDPATVRRPSPLDESLSSSDDEDASSTSSVIEMRPTSQVVGSRPNERGPILRSNSLSQEREHITIAPIPPTLLKAAEELPAPSPQVVYQPPQGFDWDLSPGNELDDSETSSSSGDNLSTTSGSLDLGFTVPQWGRSPVSVPPPTVGTGATGTVGPAALAENDVYSTAGYQEQQRKYHQVLAEEAQKSGTVIGMHAGRSKWVSGDVANDEEDEADEETDSETDDDAADSSDASMEDGEGESVKLVAATVISTSTGSSTSTASSVATVVGDPPTSPPTSTTARPPNSRKVSQPGKGILKNSGGSGGAAVTVGGGTMADGASALHSVPIGIPMASVSHPPPPVYPPQHGPAPSYFHMPPTATMSPPPAGANFNNNTASSIIGSAGFLSPSQSDVIFSGIVPSNGRGRTATRSRSASSGLSDRSRSSSKVSGTSSPLGSVSPSGYGSPSGSRANSVLGNKRSSTDVGVAGRSVAVGVGAAGRNGIASSARQSSTSPPSIGSPLANGVSFPTSNLGTIVANVPLQTDNSSTPSSSVITNKGGPPLSRSGISWSRSSGGSSSQARLGRTGSGSSISSSGSSGSVGTANASTSRSGPSAAQVAAAAPSAGAASLPLPVRKPSVGLVLPNGEPRPTVIISPKTPTGPAAVQGDSTASSGVSSPSGGMSMDTREAKLDEAMMKVRAASAAQSTESSVTTPPPSAASTLVNPGDSPYSDADEVDTGTFVEHNLANRTPSNSPMKFTKPLSSSVVPSSPPPPDPSLSPSTPSKSPPALKVVAPSPKSKSLPSSAIVTPSSAAPTLTSQATTIAGTTAGGDGTMVGKATDSIVSSAKGLLGAIWGGSNDGQGASK